MPDKTATQSKKAPPEKLENGERLPLIWERAGCLFIVALCGIPFAEFIISLLPKWVDETLKGSVQLKILLLSLPVLCVLWHFRTTDTQKQIQKAQENVDRAQGNLDASLLGLYLNLLFSENLKAKCVGLIRLASMKQQGIFSEEIDSATRQSISLTHPKILYLPPSDEITMGHFKDANLSGINLEGANLTRMNLERADLSGAYLHYAQMDSANLSYANMKGAFLQQANFRKANLQGVNFEGAELWGANFSDANMYGADLRNAKNLDNVGKLNGAKYNPRTQFPKNFKPDLAGMVTS